MSAHGLKNVDVKICFLGIAILSFSTPKRIHMAVRRGMPMTFCSRGACQTSKCLSFRERRFTSATHQGRPLVSCSTPDPETYEPPRHSLFVGCMKWAMPSTHSVVSALSALEHTSPNRRRKRRTCLKYPFRSFQSLLSASS